MKLRAIPTMLSMIPAALGKVSEDDLEKIKRITRLAYPSVRQVSTKELAQQMHDAGAPMLIDVRSAEEFAISHLRGAINLPAAEAIHDFLNRGTRPQTILYCSVGFRSTRLAHLLASKGLAGLANLEGSIFQWANEGRPVYRGDSPVYEVHPYSKRWAGLLKPEVVSVC